MQRGIQRSLIDGQSITRHQVYPLRYAPPVHRPLLQHTENQEIEGSLKKVGLRCVHLVVP